MNMNNTNINKQHAKKQHDMKNTYAPVLEPKALVGTTYVFGLIVLKLGSAELYAAPQCGSLIEPHMPYTEQHDVGWVHFIGENEGSYSLADAHWSLVAILYIILSYYFDKLSILQTHHHN